MKFILDNTSVSNDVIGLLSEEALLNPALTNEKLNTRGLKIARIEENNGEKIVYLQKVNSNILCG